MSIRLDELTKKLQGKSVRELAKEITSYDPVELKKRLNNRTEHDKRGIQLDSQLYSNLTNQVIIPDCVNPQRRKEAEGSLKLFAEYYFPNKFYMGWSSAHIELINIMEQCVVHGGGTFACAQPRGSGKTSLAETCALWALMYAYKKFVVCLGARDGLAKNLFHSIKSELENNDALWEDFPEVCEPIRAGGYNPIKYRYQMVDGKKTNITYSATSLSLPEIDSVKTSGSYIFCGSIGASLRGLKRSTSDGRSLRPDFVIIDDPQTDRTAKSKSQTEAREQVINGTILGLAGPKESITAIMPCTVIQTDDLADRFLNREKKPEWQGIRTKMLVTWPENMQLWLKYQEIRNESFREGRRGVDATEFYRANRESMDKGASVSWEERYSPPFQISAIQHAMDLYFRDPHSFHSEYQNEPLTQATDANKPTIEIKASEIIKRLSGLEYGTVPRSTLFVTGGIDIQQDVLYWLTVAWTEDYGGVICDYGAFPEQPREYFDSHNIQVKLASKFPNLTTIAPQVYAGLKYLERTVFQRQYQRDETEEMVSAEQVIIDANWNKTTDAVYQFCKEHSTKFIPGNGVGIGAAMMPMSEWQRRQGEVPPMPNQTNWRIRQGTQSKNRGRYVCFDTNYWKSRVGERLIAPMGCNAALMLYGKSMINHQLLADRLCSEYSIRTHGRGRDVDEWRTYASMSENHYFDCLVMAAVAANKMGLPLNEVMGFDTSSFTIPSEGNKTTITPDAIVNATAAPIPPKVRKVAPPPPRRVD